MGYSKKFRHLLGDAVGRMQMMDGLFVFGESPMTLMIMPAPRPTENIRSITGCCP